MDAVSRTRAQYGLRLNESNTKMGSVRPTGTCKWGETCTHVRFVYAAASTGRRNTKDAIKVASAHRLFASRRIESRHSWFRAIFILFNLAREEKDYSICLFGAYEHFVVLCNKRFAALHKNVLAISPQTNMILLNLMHFCRFYFFYIRRNLYFLLHGTVRSESS